MPSHKWFLRIDPDARKDISDLPTSAIRMGIFRSIRELLLAENPLLFSDVLKVKNYKGVWRKRQGNYRILFTLISKPITHGKHEYKGTFYLIAVRKRDESTYE